MTVSAECCALCHQIDGEANGDLLHRHLGGQYVRRVALENESAVVIPSLGPLGFGHVLVCPARHRRSIAECDTDEFRDFQRLAHSGASDLARLTGRPVHRFEHGNATGAQRVACSVEHAHLHLLPAAVDVSETLKGMGAWASVDAAASPWEVSQGREYLLYQPPRAQVSFVRVAAEGESVSSQLLRRVFAEALGRGERWNWRERPDAHGAHQAYLSLSRQPRTLAA